MKDKLMSKLLWKFIAVASIAFLICALIILSVNTISDKDKVNIIDKDGLAYVYYNDYISMLLDTNGDKIPYNETLVNDHKFVTVGNSKQLIITDTNTGIVYLILKEEDTKPVLVNLMYTEESLETVNKPSTEKKEVIVEYKTELHTDN